MFDKNSSIYIAGHTGLLGSAILKLLTRLGYKNIIKRTHRELDLTDKMAVQNFFNEEKIDYIFLCAGKVGGIASNMVTPASYLHTNLAIQDNIFEMAIKYDVKNVIFYGSSCVYPKFCSQPIKEDSLFGGPIEETSVGYATAKIAGIIGCKAYNFEYGVNRFICVIPNSIYGPFDNFNLENSHVCSALIRKIYEAKLNNDSSIVLWGSGTPKREFLFSEDVADASIFLMKNSDRLENTHYNLGAGVAYSIKELAFHIAKIIGYNGDIFWDTSKPDGTPIKMLDNSKIVSLGWTPKIQLEEGLSITCEWYKKNVKK